MNPTIELMLAAIIGHGREGLALARRYLADLEPALGGDAAQLWATIQAAGETEGPLTFVAVVAQDAELDVEQLRMLVAEGSAIDLAQLENWLATFRRECCRHFNAERLESFAADYRSGAADLDCLDSLMERFDDGTIAGPATSTAALVDYLRIMFAPETEVPPIIPSGFASIDDAIGGGFAPTEFCVIGGRPGNAKSLLAASVGRNGTWAHAAQDAHGRATIARITRPNPRPVHTLIVSIEMLRVELAARLVADLCDFDPRLLRTDRTSTLRRYKAAIDRSLDTWASVDALSMVDMTAPEIAGGDITAIIRTIASWAQAKRAEHGENVPLIAIIDYIGRCTLPDAPKYATLPTHERIGVMARKLKLAAQRNNLPIVALAQLNRDSAKRDTGTKGAKRYPRLEDLKDSGDLEQDADTVLFVDHDHANRPGEEPPDRTKLAVILAKGRSVGLGKVVHLDWTRSRTRLTEPCDPVTGPAANVEPAANASPGGAVQHPGPVAAPETNSHGAA